MFNSVPLVYLFFVFLFVFVSIILGRDPTMRLEVRTYSTTPWSPGKGEGLEVESIVNDLINYVSVMKPP